MGDFMKAREWNKEFMKKPPEERKLLIEKALKNLPEILKVLSIKK